MNELEQRWRDLGEFIREQRRVGQLSLRKLSEMAGISNPYLSQIERGLRKPSAEILQNIARALEISSETLYVRAGILDERDLEHDLVGEIRRDPLLTEEQKKTLVHIYESFAAEARAAREAAGEAAGDAVSTERDVTESDVAEPVNGHGTGANGHGANGNGTNGHGTNGHPLASAVEGGTAEDRAGTGRVDESTGEPVDAGAASASGHAEESHDDGER